jgi:hypothetical protein
MALASTQPVTEISTSNLSGGKGRPARKADHTAICEPIVEKMWDPRGLKTLWASTASFTSNGGKQCNDDEKTGEQHNGKEEYHFLRNNAAQSVESQPLFRRNISPPSSRSNKESKKAK